MFCYINLLLLCDVNGKLQLLYLKSMFRSSVSCGIWTSGCKKDRKSLDIVLVYPFTWANRSVHSLGKWQAKFKTGKFRPRIAFSICTNQSHFMKKGREGLKQKWL